MRGGRALAVTMTLAGAAAAQAPAGPDVSYVQFSETYVRDGVLADLDGDGRDDLVASVTLPGSARTLSMHLRRDASPAFRSAADRELALVRDVVAYAVADVIAHPGHEVVLFSPTRAVAVHWVEGEPRPRYTALAQIEFLWQPASPQYAFSWQAGVVDLDADGLDDLLLPEVDGYRALVQRRGDDGATRFVESRLLLPPRPVTTRERGSTRLQSQRDTLELQLDFGSSRQRGALIEVGDFVAAPRFADWNADGRTDVAALVGRRFAVWVQGEDATFTGAPSRIEDLPDRGNTLFDPSFFSQLIDLDRDGRAEVILVSGRTENDTMSSVLEVFRHDDGDAPLFGSAADKMLLQGFVSEPSFDDFDGDGVSDLAIGSLRTDVIDTIRAGSSGRVDTQLNVFVGRALTEGGRFRRPVAMVHGLQMPGRALRERDRIVSRFAHDVDGDGLRDLFLRVDGVHLSVLPIRRKGRGFSLGDPIWELETAEFAPVEFVARDDSMSLLIAERTQIVHVEFR